MPDRRIARQIRQIVEDAEASHSFSAGAVDDSQTLVWPKVAFVSDADPSPHAIYLVIKRHDANYITPPRGAADKRAVEFDSRQSSRKGAAMRSCCVFNARHTIALFQHILSIGDSQIHAATTAEAELHMIFECRIGATKNSHGGSVPQSSLTTWA